MANRDYVIVYDESGKPYIMHGWGSKATKYIKKIGEGAKARYFYTQEQLKAFYDKGKEKVDDVIAAAGRKSGGGTGAIKSAMAGVKSVPHEARLKGREKYVTDRVGSGVFKRGEVPEDKIGDKTASGASVKDLKGRKAIIDSMKKVAAAKDDYLASVKSLEELEKEYTSLKNEWRDVFDKYSNSDGLSRKERRKLSRLEREAFKRYKKVADSYAAALEARSIMRENLNLAIQEMTSASTAWYMESAFGSKPAQMLFSNYNLYK